jgi:hypothetical protein
MKILWVDDHEILALRVASQREGLVMIVLRQTRY